MSAVTQVEQPTNRQIIDEIRALYDDFTTRIATIENRFAVLEAALDERLSLVEQLVERKTVAEAVALMSPEVKRRYALAGLTTEIEEAIAERGDQR